MLDPTLQQNNKQLQSTIINGQNTLVVQAVEEKKDINLQVEVLMWSAKLCKWIPIPVSRRRQYMQPWSVKKNHCQASLKQSQACPCLQMVCFWLSDIVNKSIFFIQQFIITNRTYSSNF